MNKKGIIFLIFIAFTTTYFFINYMIGDDKFKSLKSYLSDEQKLLITKYIFPYKLISQQQEQISQLLEWKSEKEKMFKLLSKTASKAELLFKEIQRDIPTKKIEDIKLSNNKILKKYNLIDGFYSGISNDFPGSGYIDFHQNNLLVLSSKGVLSFNKSIDELYFKQIENNIHKFIGLEQFKKSHRFSIKDLLIHEDKIFIAYTDEINQDCWNTSVIYGDINYKNIQFKKFFSADECIHSSDNPDNEFEPHQSGGRMISFDNSHILLSLGDYRSRFLAQDKESVNGKIIKINVNNSNYEIVSMGHRNAQGLYFDKENNFILESEHGPQGGDEINLIEVNNINKDEPLNYGWAIVSAGEHYSGKNEVNEKKYKKYPLYKSHSEYGFIEPLKSFVPSIGISEISKIGQNRYVVGSMREGIVGRSLYFFELNNEKKIINLERVEVFERVRDLIVKNGKLYLFLEDTASIGVISLN